jgi:hypothetical protein
MIWSVKTNFNQVTNKQRSTKTSHSDETDRNFDRIISCTHNWECSNYKNHKSINQKTHSSYIITRSDKISKLNSNNSLGKWKWTQILHQKTTKCEIKTINASNLQLNGKSNSNHIVKINLRIHKKTTQNQPNDAV